MNEKEYTIYKSIDVETEEYYIGVHKTANPMDNYLGSGLLISRKVNKRGRSRFRKEIMYSFKDKSTAYTKERCLVTKDVLNDPLNLNIALGGLGGNLNDLDRSIRDRSEATKLLKYGSKAGNLNSMRAKEKAKETKLFKYGDPYGAINRSEVKIKSAETRSSNWKVYSLEGILISTFLGLTRICDYLNEPRDGNTPLITPDKVCFVEGTFNERLKEKLKSAFLIELRSGVICNIFKSGKSANKYLKMTYQEYINSSLESKFIFRKDATDDVVNQLVKFND